jgi:hypothetical protein
MTKVILAHNLEVGHGSKLCHPERTRISYYAAPKMTSCAAFIKESRMSFAEPTELYRKSGAVEGSAVCSTYVKETFYFRDVTG